MKLRTLKKSILQAWRKVFLRSGFSQDGFRFLVRPESVREMSGSMEFWLGKLEENEEFLNKHH